MRWTAAVVLFTCVAAACQDGREGKHPYKAEVVYNSIAACVQAGSTVAQCGCMMDRIQERMDQEAYAAMEVQMRSGTLPEATAAQLGEIRSACI